MSTTAKVGALVRGLCAREQTSLVQGVACGVRVNHLGGRGGSLHDDQTGNTAKVHLGSNMFQASGVKPGSLWSSMRRLGTLLPPRSMIPYTNSSGRVYEFFRQTEMFDRTNFSENLARIRIDAGVTQATLVRVEINCKYPAANLGNTNRNME